MFCLKKNLTNECNIGGLTMKEDLEGSFLKDHIKAVAT
jgi:hypothetical protein